MPELKPKRKIALIHDWLTGMRGGEKVLEVFCQIFPQAELFTLVHLPGRVSSLIEKHPIRTSPLQNFPHIGRYYRHLLPLMPWAIEQFNFSGYDLLISTSHCVAKGAIPRDQARHWCYCHTPMRYIWDQFDDYFGPGKSSWPVRWAARQMRPYLQRWDVSTTPRVHEFIANSRNVQERINRFYHREARVIYPPVDYEFYSNPSPLLPLPFKRGEGGGEGSSFYLIVSALAPYKKLDLAIETFNTLGKRLLIVGEGQESAALHAKAGPKIQFLGWRNQEELRYYYQHCRALIFPGEEDFGIVPLEAMAAGSPVIAFRKGGALETVQENMTGLFFDQQTIESLSNAILRMEKMSFDRNAISHHAETFSWGHCEAALRQTFIEYQNEMS